MLISNSLKQTSLPLILSCLILMLNKSTMLIVCFNANNNEAHQQSFVPNILKDLNIQKNNKDNITISGVNENNNLQIFGSTNTANSDNKSSINLVSSQLKQKLNVKPLRTKSQAQNFNKCKLVTSHERNKLNGDEKKALSIKDCDECAFGNSSICSHNDYSSDESSLSQSTIADGVFFTPNHFTSKNKGETNANKLIFFADHHRNGNNINNNNVNVNLNNIDQLNHPFVSNEDFVETLDSRSSSMSATQTHSHDCALVLKRTYIIDKPQNDAWGERFVFNDVDVDDKKKQVHKTELCIKYSDLDKAIQEAKHKLKFEKPKDMSATSGEISDSSLGKLGELSMSTIQILRSKFDLSNDEILNALPMIDTSATKLHVDNLCPKHLQPLILCSKTRYRTVTGHCNNLKHPIWGASKTPYSRYLPPDYADGLQMPRASKSGEPLPSARLITSLVHRDVEVFSSDYSAMFASWGQLLDHDMTRVAPGKAESCCTQYIKGECFPIPVPPKDPLYKSKCLEFTRSLPAVKHKCLLGMRAQINTVTSPIDANFIYGSTVSQANKVRKFADGKLKVWNYFEKLNLKPLLPPQTENPDEDCVARPKNLFCFLAGDVRVNEQTHLTIMQTIYVREHNRIAKALANLNIDWDDDKIYHETRHIVIAGVQHCVVNEFLPLLLGEKVMRAYQLEHVSNDKHWHGHDPSVTTAVGTGFAAAAFRYGHSMVNGVIELFDAKHAKYIRGELLRFLFKRPFLLFEPGAVDQLVSGMINSPAEKTDPYVTRELSGHLFQPPDAKFGHDLAAINIQRGRDLGVPSYNDWREWCGLPRLKSFSNLEPLLLSKTAHMYSKIYKHVDDIDLWSAGVSERRLPGAAVGPTFACIIARQFSNSKRGDRFWYENSNQPSSFTVKQLKEIKKITLSKIFCTNSDEIHKIQRWALKLPHAINNPRLNCHDLPDIDLTAWREEF